MSPSQPTPVTDPELVFEHTVDGLFRVALKGRVTPQLEQKLLAAGLNLQKALAPAYPRAQWNDLLRVTATTLWPDRSVNEAYRELGHQLIAGYTQTLVGRALMSMTRLIGPKRVLERMQRNFRSGCNYVSTLVEEREPGHVSFWINENQVPPDYIRGTLEAVVELAGGKSVQVTLDRADAEGCAYAVRWT